MKKLFAIILIVAICLTACADSNGGITSDGADSEVYWVTCNRTTRTDGMYFLKGGGASCVLWYADFSNLMQTVVCPKPNCEHNDRDSCYALGVTNGAGGVLPYGGYIYWLYIDGYDTLIYRANQDGTERKAVATMKDRKSGGVTLCAVGNKMYFLTDDTLFDEYGNLKTEPRSSYICSYDFESGEVTEHYSLLDMFPNADEFVYGIDGVWNGGIYINTVALTGEHSAVTCDLRFDISDGTLEKSEIDPWQISGEYMILLNGSTVKVIRESGEEYEFKQTGASQIMGARIVNGKLFVKDTVIDIETGNRYENLVDVIPGPLAYEDGKYLIYDWTKYTFEMVPESKVIGDEKT